MAILKFYLLQIHSYTCNLHYIFKQDYDNFIFKVTSEYEPSEEEKKAIEEWREYVASQQKYEYGVGKYWSLKVIIVK